MLGDVLMAYMILGAVTQGKRKLGWLRHRWKESIKISEGNTVRSGTSHPVQLAQGRVQKYVNIVTYRPTASQRLYKHIPEETDSS
jgi:hypothetical protein